MPGGREEVKLEAAGGAGAAGAPARRESPGEPDLELAKAFGLSEVPPRNEQAKLSPEEAQRIMLWVDLERARTGEARVRMSLVVAEDGTWSYFINAERVIQHEEVGAYCVLNLDRILSVLR